VRGAIEAHCAVCSPALSEIPPQEHSGLEEEARPTSGRSAGGRPPVKGVLSPLGVRGRSPQQWGASCRWGKTVPVDTVLGHFIYTAYGFFGK